MRSCPGRRAHSSRKPEDRPPWKRRKTTSASAVITGSTVHYHRLDNHGWRCKRCIGEAVTRRKQRVRRMLIDEAGGRCAVCGYDRCIINLHFHHVDPSTKSFLMASSIGRALATFRDEAKKCVLVCANCHGEIEAGLIDSPPPQARFEH